MSLKYIVVTGGNKGIGKAICEKILRSYPDTFVYLCSRDVGRGNDAVASVIDSIGADASDRIECVQMDVADEDSVIMAAHKLSNSHSPGTLYGIVNNAGVGFGLSTLDVVKVNYFGPKIVTQALLPLLNPEGGRIVNVSSAAGPMFVSKLPLTEQSLFVDSGVTSHMIERTIQDAIDSKCYESKNDNRTYGFSKACLNVLTRDIAEMYPSLVVNSCTPGFILTDMTANMGATNDPEKGTVAPLHCLFGENIGTGLYFGSDGVRSPLDRYRAPGDPPYLGE